jgi:hypothetical protein
MGTYRALLRGIHTGSVDDVTRRRALAGVVTGLDGALDAAAVPFVAHRDALDAVAAAYAAWAFTGGGALSVGDAEEGLIWFAGPRE